MMDRCWLTLAVLLVVASVPDGTSGMSESGLKQMQTMMKNVCKNKSGVKVDVLNKAKEGKFEEDPKFKCYLKCVLGMMQTIKNDKITPEAAQKQAEMLLPEKMKKPTLDTLQACKNAKGVDGCDIAYHFTVCSYNDNKENFFIPL